ncbi:hypothetical protein V6N12_026991 [Hibiscus sabdariffa]|uniref:Uncharacterized protein n=1 Tax=Hibiscus sabdariffa TaxID=183260 RepID=A0ABR2DTE0_9ROSI
MATIKRTKSSYLPYNIVDNRVTTRTLEKFVLERRTAYRAIRERRQRGHSGQVASFGLSFEFVENLWRGLTMLLSISIFFKRNFELSGAISDVGAIFRS